MTAGSMHLVRPNRRSSSAAVVTTGPARAVQKCRHTENHFVSSVPQFAHAAARYLGGRSRRVARVNFVRREH